jgi:hypothetical protein
MFLFALHCNRKVRISFRDEDAEVGTKYITPVELLDEQTKGIQVNPNNTGRQVGTAPGCGQASRLKVRIT